MHAKPPIPRVLKQCSSRRLGDPDRYVACMIRTASILLIAITLTGCDPISRTEIAVRPDSNVAAEVARDEVVRISAKIANEFGLEESERRDSDTSFTDTLSRLGENPDIWLTVNHEPSPRTIEITEMFIEHPTEKHTKLANSLVQELNAGGYDSTVVYQTPPAMNWTWLFIPVGIVMSIFVGWKVLRRPTNKPKPDIAT